jgi:pyruvate dehydrogenase E1 component alpha subunit
VDGNDILAVYAAAQEAVERARKGGGPTLIECVTYRLMMHTTADDPKRYRSDEEVEQWRKRDPLIRFERYLLDKGLLSEAQRKQVESEVLDEIQTALEVAEKQIETLGNPMEMFDHAYADIPPYLKEQKAYLASELSLSDAEGRHG